MEVFFSEKRVSLLAKKNRIQLGAKQSFWDLGLYHTLTIYGDLKNITIISTDAKITN